MNALVLVSLLLVSAIGGVPSVLLARVIHWVGLRPLASALSGSLLLPLIWIGFMTGGQIEKIVYVPLLFPGVTFGAGVLVSLLYFRRRA